MKIDDIIQKPLINPDMTVKENAEVGTGPVAEKDGIILSAASETEISLPDFLQVFGRMVARRQDLISSLPASLMGRLSVLRLPQGEAFSVFTADPVSIQQGVSGLVRENRMIPDAMRLIVSEMDLVEHVPELVTVVAAVNAGEVLSTPAVTSSSAHSTDRRDNAIPEVLQIAVDEGLNKLLQVAVPDSKSPSPAAVLASLVDKTLQTGVLGKELSGWVDTIGPFLNSLADDPAVIIQLDSWIAQANPKIVLAAQMARKPELIPVWAAVQAWGGDSSSAAPAGSETVGTTIESLLQSLASETILTQPQQLSSLPSAFSSLAGRFEWVLTALASQPEKLNCLLALLPEVMLTVKSAWAEQTEGKAREAVSGKLASTAPRWLLSLTENANKTEILDFWVAAKAADLSPWVKLGQTERQQSMEVLKELASTYDQPDMFRLPGDDATVRGLMMQSVLYASGQAKPYPALIQVYEENKKRGNPPASEQEVWVRISLQTDHIGTVDFSFRLQDKKFLTIFSRFADSAVSSEFLQFLPEIRQEVASTSLELKKFAVTQRNGTGVVEDG